MPDYISKKGSANKIWRYTVNGLTVNIEYGRVGRALRPSVHTFSSTSERDRFIAKKVAEKTNPKKGYELVTEEKVKQEVQTAKQLGTQYKISKMLFVSQKGTVLTKIASYDPKKFVYVEILNSWKKDITRLLLSKEQSWVLTGGVSVADRTIKYGNKVLTNNNFVAAVRGVLRRLSEQVVEAIKTIKFAAVGARKLFDDDDEPTAEAAPAFASLLSQIDCSSVDNSVVSRFASSGARVLEL